MSGVPDGRTSGADVMVRRHIRHIDRLIAMVSNSQPPLIDPRLPSEVSDLTSRQTAHDDRPDAPQSAAYKLSGHIGKFRHAAGLAAVFDTGLIPGLPKTHTFTKLGGNGRQPILISRQGRGITLGNQK
ncbi:hypothetical protein B0H11DRAFT_1914243 [Mycena galericulata]|nr:hypothetical protein B0H11DRAFT_1914243 [Mycena galericulata]